MVTAYTKIIGLPILDLRTHQQVGIVGDIIIRKSNLSIYGLLLKRTLLFDQPQVITHNDLVEIGNSAVIINNENAIAPLKDSLRCHEAVRHGQVGTKQQVVTQSGKRIGKVFDYTISIPDLSISRFYVKNLLLSEYLIPVTAVSELKGKTLIVRDDFSLVTVNNLLAQPESA